ncbi:MAG: hypothetical protein GWP61_16330, partial [Chloroflexi bacterium]|nr:hypothetical protein [Chloroflexota bacterium]
MKKSRNRHSFILLFFVLIVSLLFTAVLTSARAGKAAPMAERVFMPMIARPKLEVHFAGHIGGANRGVAVQGNYAYIGEGPKLTILDIANPAHPVVMGKTLPLPNIVQDVVVTGNYAYVVGVEYTLRVIDIANPAAPFIIGSYDTPAPAYSLGVAVAGNYAYVADYYQGLRIIDVSNPAFPAEVGFYDTPGIAHDVTVRGSLAYVAGGFGLSIIDVSTPATPIEAGFYDTPSSAHGVAVAGNYAYITAGGLRIIDVTNPAEPVETGFYDTPWYA